MDKYQSYKLSGVEWIGNIPKHWEMVKVKWITLDHRQGYYSSKPYDEQGYRVIRITDINDDNTIEINNSPFYDIDTIEYERFRLVNGDFLFPRTGGVGRFGIFNSDIPSIYGSFLIRFRFYSLLDHLFIKYYLISDIFLNEIQKEIHGGVNQNVHVENIKDCLISIPKDFNEQHQIVHFLNERTEIIDKLISTKERKIDILREQRTSLINHVITKGLNLEVKMKDSGLDSVGEIPEHWEVNKIKWLTLEHRQGYYSSKPYDENGYRVVRITDLNDDNTIDIINSPFYEVEQIEYERFGLKSGDFLFPRTGGVGRFGIFNLDVPSIYGSFLIRFRFSSEVNHSFIKYYLTSTIFLNEIQKEIHGGVNQNVHVENIKDCKIFYPSGSTEQHQIVEHLDIQTKEINDLISMEQKKIDLLKEYRQSLISEVITGKIDVRTNVN